VIGEIFITRILIVSLIIYIISTYNTEDLVKYYNKKINSKDKEIIKYAKRQKKIIILSLWLFSITSVFVFIHVSYKVFYKTSLIEFRSFDKTTELDKIGRQFYRMVETGRFIREVD
jgi:peptidoglycan biosynthesis protein MviN/MurJ (putative lipid II flippase)